jgi:hypothetical protein
LERGVRHDAVFGFRPEELPARLASRFPPDVPESHVERADRTDHGAAAAVHRAAGVEFLPDPLGLERILPEEHVFQPQAHRVGARRLDAGFRDPRIDVGLADAGDALVGMDEDDDVILRRGRRAGVEVGDEQRMAFDAGDFHGVSPPGGRRTLYRRSAFLAQGELLCHRASPCAVPPSDRRGVDLQPGQRVEPFPAPKRVRSAARFGAATRGSGEINTMSIQGKTVLLTGASRGIGRSIALRLARENVRLALCARDHGGPRESRRGGEERRRFRRIRESV